MEQKVVVWKGYHKCSFFRIGVGESQKTGMLDPVVKSSGL